MGTGFKSVPINGCSFVVATTIGKQSPCHYLFFFPKKKISYPIILCSKAIKITRDIHIIIQLIESKLTQLEHIKIDDPDSWSTAPVWHPFLRKNVHFQMNPADSNLC